MIEFLELADNHKHEHFQANQNSSDKFFRNIVYDSLPPDPK